MKPHDCQGGIRGPSLPGRRQLLRAGLRWLAFLVCIGLFAFALSKEDLGAGWARIRAMGPIALLALVPFPIGILFDANGWRTLLASLDKRARLWTLFRVRLSIEAVTNSMPAGMVWAEAIAPVLVSRQTGVPIAAVVASQTAKRWLLVRTHGAYVAGAAIAGMPALTIASRALVGSEALVVGVVAGGLGLVLLALGIELLASRGELAGRLSTFLCGTRFASLAKWIEERRHHFTSADTQITQLSADVRTTRIATAWVLGLWLTEGIETFLILRLLGADLGLATVMSFDAALSVVRSAAIFAPAGIGVQDIGYIAVLDAYGVPSASGIAPAFIVMKRMKEAVWVAVGFILLGLANGKERLETPSLHPESKSV